MCNGWIRKICTRVVNSLFRPQITVVRRNKNQSKHLLVSMFVCLDRLEPWGNQIETFWWYFSNKNRKQLMRKLAILAIGRGLVIVSKLIHPLRLFHLLSYLHNILETTLGVGCKQKHLCLSLSLNHKTRVVLE